MFSEGVYVTTAEFGPHFSVFLWLNAPHLRQCWFTALHGKVMAGEGLDCWNCFTSEVGLLKHIPSCSGMTLNCVFKSLSCAYDFPKEQSVALPLQAVTAKTLSVQMPLAPLWFGACFSSYSQACFSLGYALFSPIAWLFKKVTFHKDKELWDKQYRKDCGLLRNKEIWGWYRINSQQT